ncbi:MAG TPA: VOC family protein [Chloroflexota bacterium]|nr:VOC family protein [Chloroflexota bacterium]
MAVNIQAPPVERIDHWTLVSSDIERTKRFYTEVLGAQSRERSRAGGGPVAVRLANTTIDFFEPDDHQRPSPGGEGQHHAYVIRYEDFDTWVERFRSFGIPLRFGNFGTRMSIMFDDPDGYHFEFTVPMESRERARQELTRRGFPFED